MTIVLVRGPGRNTPLYSKSLSAIIDSKSLKPLKKGVWGVRPKVKRKGPGRYEREGISLFQLMERFPDEASACKWFEEVFWSQGRYCPHCGSFDTEDAKHLNMAYRCCDCGGYFSVKTGTLMHASNLPLRKWVFAIYLHVTSIKGVTSMKLHRDIGVTQKTAWYMLQRIREAWKYEAQPFDGPIEVDETLVGGRESNKPLKKRRPGSKGGKYKSIVVGAKDRSTKKMRAAVIPDTTAPTLYSFVVPSVVPGGKVYTDLHAGYRGLEIFGLQHGTVNHAGNEYLKYGKVLGPIHTQGIEGMWGHFKRSLLGVYIHVSPKHLHRYVREFACRHNVRDLDTIDQMIALAQGMQGKTLPYSLLTGKHLTLLY